MDLAGRSSHRHVPQLNPARCYGSRSVAGIQPHLRRIRRDRRPRLRRLTLAQLRGDAKLNGPYFSRWGALYPSQQNTLKAFFVPGGGGGCTNCSALQPQEVQDLIAKADGQVDQDKAIEYYQQAQKVLAEQLPIVPMFYEKYMFVTSEKVTALPSSQGSPIWSQVTVA